MSDMGQTIPPRWTWKRSGGIMILGLLLILACGVTLACPALAQDDNAAAETNSDWGEDEADNDSSDGGFAEEEEAPTVARLAIPQWAPQTWETPRDNLNIRQHIFCAGSRLGWASALCNLTGGQSDETIAEHLNRASDHVEATYNLSIPPVKAWPNYARTRQKHQSMGRQLLQKAGTGRGPTLRRSLHSRIKSQAMALIRKISFQGRIDDLKQMPNCDSHTMHIGFSLSYAAQTLTFAIEAEARQVPQRDVRRIIRQGLAEASSAVRYMRELEDMKVATGACVNLSDIAEQLHRGISGDKSLVERATATQEAWTAILVAMGGGAEDTEAVGRYVFANLAQDCPRGTSQKPPKLYQKDSGQEHYYVVFQKSFSFAGFTDQNPGVTFYLTNRAGIEDTLTGYNNWVSATQSTAIHQQAINKHQGRGQWRVTGNQHEDAVQRELYLRLIWYTDDWMLRIHMDDYPNHRDSMFSGQANMIDYAQRMLDKLAPRINNIPNAGLGSAAPAAPEVDASAEPSDSPSNITLLNLEQN